MQTMESTKKKLPMVWIAAGIVVVLLFCVGLAFALAVLPLQKATNAYNEAVAEYNVHADAYNALIGATSVANLDGFPSSADKLSTVDADLSAVVHSVFNGNSAKKTQTDIQTIQELSGYLEENSRILKQITAPSGEWVMNRLRNVDDVLEIQAVTPGNDPNGLLNKENGGYTACIYFTATGINVEGTSPVSKGTDGGGAIEVYGTLEDAEARGQYLHGFDNTILYTGSYAVVGTMVIRISYIYTDVEQYEMTDRIVKEFTRLETT